MWQHLPSTQNAHLTSFCVSLDSRDFALLLPGILSLVLPPKFILFSYWPVGIFIKPITATNLHSVQRDYSTVVREKN